MKKYGLYRPFPMTMTGDEIKKAIPNMAKALLAKLLDDCDRNALKPNLETLAIVYKYGSDETIGATLAAKVEANEIFCDACGLRIHGGKFCSECGKPISLEGR